MTGILGSTRLLALLDSRNVIGELETRINGDHEGGRGEKSESNKGQHLDVETKVIESYGGLDKF